MSEAEVKSVEKRDVRWIVVLWYIHVHVLGLYGLLLLITASKWLTIFFTLFLTLIGCLGVTLGAHRLWSHQSYKASRSLKLFFMIAHTIAGVGPIYDWVLAHRIHHRFHGTDKDPYNHNKGFLYSHYLSHFMSQRPDYESIKAEIDMRDIEMDLIVWLQKTFYWILFPIIGILLPLNTALEYWDESLAGTVCIVGFLRLAITLNVSCLVNSAALIWSIKDNEKIPVEGTSIFFVNKTLWPSYHYTLPWDWKSGEFGNYEAGCGTFILKMLHELGFVSELQSTTGEDIREILYEVAMKRKSWKQMLSDLKESSELRARQQKLLASQ